MAAARLTQEQETKKKLDQKAKHKARFTTNDREAYDWPLDHYAKGEGYGITPYYSQFNKAVQ